MSANGPRVLVVPQEGWAAAVAAELAARLVERPSLRVCLPTGGTPTPVYAALAKAVRAGRCSLGAATVVLLDEWVGLAPGDPARCDVRLQGELLDHLEARPAFVPIGVDAADLDAAVARHDAAAVGLDLAVVGLGMNGHIGFNEPGSSPSGATRVVALQPVTITAATAQYGARSAPSGGVTVGFARLLAAQEVWLLVTGERKAAVLRQALEGPEDAACPASLLRRHPRLTVFADEAAAGELRGT